MQVTETEIILPLINAGAKMPFSRKDILSLCIVGIFMLGGGVFLLIPHGGGFPTASDVPLSILLIVLSILILLPSIALLVISIQSDSTRSTRVVRIDHEDVAFPHLFSTVVKWSEISSLVPYTWTYLGSRHVNLGIVPLKPEAIISRIIAEKSRNFLSRAMARMNMHLYHKSNALSPLNIPQVLLPISIDELIVLIQERFANELREHHVTVLGWQDETG